MNRNICIHGHFYQPPRENPWLNDVEKQDSAYPYHDWNERITAECYARNSASRILDGDERIVDIINNYSRISFNFGPTLLEWMEKKAPLVYDAIVQADKESQERFNGHGSAIAQAYNHMIMPLANERDKYTQVIWGVEDFRSRFGRDPEGMWLPETAVNTDSLEVLAEHGIRFTILSPFQANRFRSIGEEEWKDGTEGKIDPRVPYLCNLPSGRSITLFFYEGPVSMGIAFEGMLNSGETFAGKMKEILDKEPEAPQLAHIATDGETYGHHHRYGEMALSYSLEQIDQSDDANLTIYGEYLDNHPPEYEVEIIEDSSWSCVHGIERWRSNCGCNSGGHPGWTQDWRAPLRESFDWLRDSLAPVYEKEMGKFVNDPWRLRNEYIQVILDRSDENVSAFLEKHAGTKLAHHEQVTFLKLLEMQLHLMLMYTSCGWFFDEVTGIETMQDIFYAARALQLANEITHEDYEGHFLELLSRAPSNIPDHKNAAVAFEKFAKTTRIDLLRVGAHYAVSSLFEKYPEKSSLYSFEVQSESRDYHEIGKYRLAIGKAVIRSMITWEEKELTYAVIHLGDHHIFGGVRVFIDETSFQEMQKEMAQVFEGSDIYENIILLDKHFGTHNYSFWHLFRDDQQKVLDKVLNHTLKSIEGQFEQIYDDNFPVMTAIKKLDMGLPTPLKVSVDFIVNLRLREIFEAEDPDLEQLKKANEQRAHFDVELDELLLNYIVSDRIIHLMRKLKGAPDDTDFMRKIIAILKEVHQFPFDVDLWEAQNLAFEMKQEYYVCKDPENNSEDSNWCELFEELFQNFNLKL